MDSRTIEFIKTNIYYNFIIPAEDKDKVKSTLDRIFQTNRNPIAKADLFTKMPKNSPKEKNPTNFIKKEK